jgi:hypothetical protein
MLRLFPNSSLSTRLPVRGILLLALAVTFSPKFSAAQPSSTPPQQDSGEASPAQAAAAQTAERKRKFEADEQKLENGGASHDDASSAAEKQPTLFVSPAVVGMLVNQQQRFTVFDAAGHNLTAKAEWSLSNTDVTDFVGEAGPAIIAKQDGTVTLRASVGGETSEAQIKVYRDKLPMGAILWQAPKIPGYTTKHIIQAVPTSH